MLPAEWFATQQSILHSMPIGQILTLSQIAATNGLTINRTRRFMEELALGGGVEVTPRQIGNHLKYVYVRKK